MSGWLCLVEQQYNTVLTAEYNDMKTELVEFLQGFAREGQVSYCYKWSYGEESCRRLSQCDTVCVCVCVCAQVVSQRDVEGFFEGLQARKRRRLDTGDGVPPASCHF